MTTITDFLLARVTEDESEVGTLGPGESDDGAGPNGIGWAEVGAISEVLMASPARVLAECEAKRRIVEMHYEGEMYCSWSQDSMATHEATDTCDELRALAQVYADHPDYNPEWRI